MLRRGELVAAFLEAGLRRGDVVLVQSALWTIGPVEAGSGREAILEFYLSGFQEVLGPEGTLIVCTSFEDYGRYGTLFVREESPSRVGVFSEYVRTRPGAVRSMHPIVSVAGLGARAEEICGGPHYNGFGYNSPYGRLHRLNAKLVGLGMGFAKTLGFAHYIEALYGVPYQYTKLFPFPVYSGGKEIPGPFTMSVRYLDFSIAYDFSHFERRLLEVGVAVEVPVGRAMLQLTTAQSALDVGIDCLNRDRYFFLREPPRFRRGEYPVDDTTGPARDVYHLPGPNIARFEPHSVD